MLYAQCSVAILLSVINVHEVLIASLGFFLKMNRNMPRDAGYLLGVELPFLTDITNFKRGNGHARVRVFGEVINLLLLTLGFVKVFMVIWAVLRRRGGRVFGFIALAAIRGNAHPHF